MKRPASDLLDTILRDKLRWVREQQSRRSAAQLRKQAETASPPRGFTRALRAMTQAGRPAVIAEIKRASPSAGVIREPFEPATLADDYHRAGAACLSVLTDQPHFQGADEHLALARAACPLPVLRKDFILSRYQLDESRVLGADCVLLIVAALAQPELAALYRHARELQLDILLEVHDGEELQRALELEPELLGINNRDLRTFSTSLDTTLQLLDQLPAAVQLVTESGIHSRAQVLSLQRHGVNGFLVGEALLRRPAPGDGLRELFFPETLNKQANLGKK